MLQELFQSYRFFLRKGRYACGGSMPFRASFPCRFINAAECRIAVQAREKELADVF